MSTTTIQLQDVETARPRTPPSDPMSLGLAIKSSAEIESLSTLNTPQSRFLARRRSSTDKRDVKGIQSFYESQNAHIERMLKSVDDHRREAQEEAVDNRLRFLIAVHGSLAANVVLSILQLYAAISSGSLSLFATAIDSIFDPLSNLLLIFSHRAASHVDTSRFPSGKARLETAGNIGFGFLMIAVSLVLIAMSSHDLATSGDSETKKFYLPSIIAVSIALATKLALFFYCYSLRHMYSQVMILWRDHRNDLPVNTFGLLTSIAGSKLRWWVDPLGAIVIGFVIMIAWGKVVYEESLLLIGVTSSHEFKGLVTYIAMTHDDRITHIDTVRAYHAGPRIIVEVDIVMPEDMSLRQTHDVAESLQIKLEDLPDVERAYVHVDWEWHHQPEHSLKKKDL